MNMIRTPVRQVTISGEQEGQRLDNFLLRELKGIPKSRIYKMFRKGEVRVNKGRIKPSYKINTGDIIRIPPLHMESLKKEVDIPDLNKKIIRNSVLENDQDLLVLNKPAGMPVHAGSKLYYGVIEAVRAAFPELAYVELAHRLDRYTSGCLLLAKNRRMLQQIHDVLRDHTAIKTYTCLVAGAWPAEDTEVKLPLLRDRSGPDSRTIVSDEGKNAHSRFEIIEQFQQVTLMKVTIFTGRTHQIRVHAAESGHPVIGDDMYGDQELNKVFAGKGLTRQFLHSSSIELKLDDESRTFKAPLAQDLKALLKTL